MWSSIVQWSPSKSSQPWESGGQTGTWAVLAQLYPCRQPHQNITSWVRAGLTLGWGMAPHVQLGKAWWEQHLNQAFHNESSIIFQKVPMCDPSRVTIFIGNMGYCHPCSAGAVLWPCEKWRGVPRRCLVTASLLSAVQFDGSRKVTPPLTSPRGSSCVLFQDLWCTYVSLWHSPKYFQR